jgi:hypothetical protein
VVEEEATTEGRGNVAPASAVLMGMHAIDSDETIFGNWDLTDSVNSLNCAGPFIVTLQP